MVGCLALLLAGCGPKRLVPADFAFVTPTTTFQELYRILPPPDRAYLQDNTMFWDWDLTNAGLCMRIKDGTPPWRETNRVQVVGVVPRAEFIDFSTNRGAHHETNTP